MARRRKADTETDAIANKLGHRVYFHEEEFEDGFVIRGSVWALDSGETILSFYFRILVVLPTKLLEVAIGKQAPAQGGPHQHYLFQT
jgi:hypothetical protein